MIFYCLTITVKFLQIYYTKYLVERQPLKDWLYLWIIINSLIGSEQVANLTNVTNSIAEWSNPLLLTDCCLLQPGSNPARDM